MADKKDAVGCAQVGEDCNRFSESRFGLRIDGGFLEYGEADLAGEFSEILYGDHPDVGGVVPFIGQLPADRRIAREKQLQPDAPVTEIGETDDAFFPDAHHRLNQGGRFIDLLQGLAEDHVIKGVVRISGAWICLKDT
jgi:hypothetical protein